MSSDPTQSARPAVVLLSGGLDSSTTLAIAVEQGFTPHAISFRYGQRHSRELAAAQAVGRHFGVRDHRVIEIDLRAFGGSALTADEIAVPHERSIDAMGHGIPVTYVPARNLIFLSLATAFAEVIGANDVFLGINYSRLLGLSRLPPGVPGGLPAHGESGDESGDGGWAHAALPCAADRHGQGGDRARGDAAGRAVGADVELLRGRRGRLWDMR